MPNGSRPPPGQKNLTLGCKLGQRDVEPCSVPPFGIQKMSRCHPAPSEVGGAVSGRMASAVPPRRIRRLFHGDRGTTGVINPPPRGCGGLESGAGGQELISAISGAGAAVPTGRNDVRRRPRREAGSSPQPASLSSSASPCALVNNAPRQPGPPAPAGSPAGWATGRGWPRALRAGSAASLRGRGRGGEEPPGGCSWHRGAAGRMGLPWCSGAEGTCVGEKGWSAPNRLVSPKRGWRAPKRAGEAPQKTLGERRAVLAAGLVVSPSHLGCGRANTRPEHPALLLLPFTSGRGSSEHPRVQRESSGTPRHFGMPRGTELLLLGLCWGTGGTNPISALPALPVRAGLCLPAPRSPPDPRKCSGPAGRRRPMCVPGGPAVPGARRPSGEGFPEHGG